jgi:hypothetical protein
MRYLLVTPDELITLSATHHGSGSQTRRKWEPNSWRESCFLILIKMILAGVP